MTAASKSSRTALTGPQRLRIRMAANGGRHVHETVRLAPVVGMADHTPTAASLPDSVEWIGGDVHEHESLTEYRDRTRSPHAKRRSRQRRAERQLKRALRAAAVVAVLASGAAAQPDPADAATVAPRAPSLSDARHAPSWIAVMPVGGTVDGRVCADESTDNAAYTWRGAPLGRQRSGGEYGSHVWPRRDRSGRVTLRGGVWRNHTSQPVVVATWCDR
jgi:hypothetical protein